jgi:hypothetical protein
MVTRATRDDRSLFCCASLPANRRFKFEESRQFFITSPNETLSVVAVCINDPDRSPFTIDR